MPRPANEADRLAALHDLHILQTGRDAHLDAVCRTAGSLFGVPIALVSLVGADQQWFAGRCGTEIDGTPREIGFCNHTIASDDVLMVEDARTDPRFATNPLVTVEPGLRFYAGAPLILKPGIRLGSLCVLDTEPRRLTDAQIRQLQDLAEVVTAHLRLHEARAASERMAAALVDRDAALRDSQVRYQSLADSLPQMVWTVSAESRVTTYRNASFRAYYGEGDGGGSRSRSRNHPQDLDRMAAAWEAAVAGEHAFEVEGRLRRHDGSYRWHRMVMIPRFHQGVVTEWLGTALDIDHIIAAQKSLEETTDLLRLAQEAAEAGVWEWDMRGGRVRLSPMSARMHNLPTGPDAQGSIEITLATWKAQVHPEDRAGLWADVKRAIQNRAAYSSEFRIAHPDAPDKPRWVQSFGRLVLDEAGEPARCVGLQIDVTERKTAEQRIAYIASHDVLTGLSNRTVFHACLDRRLAEVRRDGGRAGVLCLDLDRFKTVNDTLGHLAGDQLLRVVAARIRAAVRSADIVARLGGDEFAVVLSDVDGTEQAQALAQGIIDAVGEPIDLGSQVVTIGASIGIALAPDHGCEPDLAYRHADLALYRAKGAGRSACRVYTASMDAALENRNQIEFDMRAALRHGGFTLHYQPVVALDSGSTIGFEALLRWPHPTRGMISPADFIPIAEETGLVVPIGAWVLREACREAASWPGHLRIAVNVSAVQFQQPGLEQSVIGALAASGLDASRLELEVTESVLIQDGDAVIGCLHRLRAMGVRIALDDFGTGYSSLSYLRRFPFDKIKIDRSFVREIDDPDARAIVRAVVSIGERLRTAITAEGVETQDQLALVRQVGCTEVQGFLFSQPLPADEALRFVQDACGRAAA